MVLTSLKVQKTIILTDDDPGLQHAVPLIFKNAGYRVTVFSNGENILNNNFDPPDLFLLDKQLSGTNGLDLCRFLKSQESTKHIPVLMISASPMIADLALQAGADGFLEKPFKMKDLRELVAKHLERG